MNDDEADVLLKNNIAAANVARQLLARYEQEVDNWKNTVKTAKMAEIKAKALEASIDISAWDGKPAPVVDGE